MKQIHPAIKKQFKLSLKVKLFALLGILIMGAWLGYQVTKGVNEWYKVHEFQFNKVISVELKWPVEIVERKPNETIREIVKEVLDENYLFVRVSHYWPPLGGTNCGNFKGGECTSKLANGERWQEWVGLAIACPKELEFGTKLRINGREWVCKDRGSKITKDGDTYWVDMLTPEALVDYGSIVKADIIGK